MYETSCKTVILWSVFSIHCDFASCQLLSVGSNKPIKILCRSRCFLRHQQFQSALASFYLLFLEKFLLLNFKFPEDSNMSACRVWVVSSPHLRTDSSAIAKFLPFLPSQNFSPTSGQLILDEC